MIVHLRINGIEKDLAAAPGETLLTALRRAGYASVKHGCETGECGACAVLMRSSIQRASESREAALSPFRIVNTCVMLAAQADGADILTCESLGDRNKLSALQQCFIDNGAIQCGYCTPAQLLAAKALLDRNPDPSEAEVREAISGVLCRCTGYLKPVQAVLNAARLLRGEGGEVEAPFRRIVTGPAGGPMSAPHTGDMPWEPGDRQSTSHPERQRSADTQVLTDRSPIPDLQSPISNLPFAVAPSPETSVVGKAEKKVDAAKLAQGKPAFVDDFPMPGMLHAAMLTSPHAHARITDIRADQARALPGVHAVLTYKDVKRVMYASGGQSYPNPPPYDQVSLDNKVRHVGDRVAVVAAETPEIAEQALRADRSRLRAIAGRVRSRRSDAARRAGHPRRAGRDRHQERWAQHRGAGVRRSRRHRPGLRRVRCDHRTRIPCAAGAAGQHRAARVHDLVGRGRPAGHPHQHPSPVPRPAHGCTADRPAGQAHPGDQAPRRRRIRRQAGDADRGPVRAPDPGHRPAGAVRVHPRTGVHLGPLAPPAADRVQGGISIIQKNLFCMRCACTCWATPARMARTASPCRRSAACAG